MSDKLRVIAVVNWRSQRVHGIEPRPACCVKHGVPARVSVCGPACHEAHTYVPPCEQAPGEVREDR